MKGESNGGRRGWKGEGGGRGKVIKEGGMGRNNEWRKGKWKKR